MTAYGGLDPDAMARDDAAATPTGGRVERTGLGVVRRGEIVVPDRGSDAILAPASAPMPAGLLLEIPVLVEIGPSVDEITEAAAELALRKLRAALAARTVG